MKECNISAKLAELRTAKGVTQDEVAEALSVSNKTVSKWENGTSSPDISMLVSLAEYYEVSTDALLGLNEQGNAKGSLADRFKGLDRREAHIKLFEIAEETFPAYLSTHPDNCGPYDDIDAVPLLQGGKPPRNQIAMNELFNFSVCSDDVNLAVMLLGNKSNFSWLLDEKKQLGMIRLFGLLADSDALKIMSFIHSSSFPGDFTAEHMAETAGTPLDKTKEVLEKCCELDICSKLTAHMKDKDVTVYESFGDGLILSLISIAYERMFGSHGYNYNTYNSSKMIRGEKA